MKILFYIYSISFLLLVISCNHKDSTSRNLYKNNRIIATDYLSSEGKLDSTNYFSSKNFKEATVIYLAKSETDSLIVFNQNGSIQATGHVKHKNQDFRLGTWKFNTFSNNDSIVEYYDIKGTSYVNQYYQIDKKTRDTLYKSNFYQITMNNKIQLKDTLMIRVFLKEPHYSYDSDMFVVLPKVSRNLKKDFSNFEKIERDTFFSLKLDGINHKNIPKSIPQNHFADFGLTFDRLGSYELNGCIIEEVESQEGILQRRLFFRRKILVQ
jgi:hypothetical protein